MCLYFPTGRGCDRHPSMDLHFWSDLTVTPEGMNLWARFSGLRMSATTIRGCRDVMSSSNFLQKSLRLESDAASLDKSWNPTGAARHRQRNSDVSATKYVHLQCMMPVMHRTSTPRWWSRKSSAARTFFHVSGLLDGCLATRKMYNGALAQEH